MTKNKVAKKIKQRYYKNQICLEKIEDYKKSRLFRKN